MLTVDPYPYQNEVIDRALDRGNLLIAYGMGLGKTLITMGICEELLGDGEITMSCIVVPASLKWQWAQALVWGTDVEPREIRLKGQKIVVPERRHAVVIDGTPKQRDAAYNFAWNYRPNYVILGYENVVNDYRWVNRLQPELIAGDEITAIKSFNAERSKMFKQWGAPFRFGLTGTPIDNRADELYSIMEWVAPEELGRWDIFERAYISRDSNGRVRKYKNIDVLHKKTKGFVARKTRYDPEVAPFMPKDFHKEVRVGLTGKAVKLYREISRDLIERLSEMSGMTGFDLGSYYAGEGSGSGTAEQGNAMARFSALAMLCDHPLLLVESAKKFEKSMTSEAESPRIQGSKYAYDLMLTGRLDWITDKTTSPKFEECVDEIHDLMDERAENKVLVFSFSKQMLRIFQKRLTSLGIGSVIFDGDMNAVEKEAAKQRFKTDPSVRVFLSSDAGGMGVDLPEANYLINYNHPWSAGKADQRNSRRIRAGSLWDEVWVINYLVEESVEEWKFQVLELKRRISAAILDGAPTKEGGVKFDVDSLLGWLDSHAVG